MLKIENAFLIDICLGFPIGKLWFPASLPQVEPGAVPATFLFKGDHLAAAKILARQNDPLLSSAVLELKARAEPLLDKPNPSVVHKETVPVGGTLNDYYSLAKYWWPNPNTSDQLPYIQRDGEVNPDCYADCYDLVRLKSFTEDTFILALTAFLTEQQDYAEKAAAMVRTWFVNPSTRQSPHFRFAQITPGVDTLRHAGLIEARYLIYVCEALQLLKQVNTLDDDTYQAIKNWYSEFLEWIETSKQGQRALGKDNNIAFWVELQRLVYAHFTGQETHANNIVSRSVLPRLKEQVDLDGKLPAELSRAKPYDYVAFTLLALAGLSNASRHGEIKLADYADVDGRSFQSAFNWFTETLELNNLPKSGLALVQLAARQRKLVELEQENKKLKAKLSQPGVEQDHQYNEEDFTHPELQLKNKLKQAEQESARLRAELNSCYQLLLDHAWQNRAVGYMQEAKEYLSRAETSETDPLRKEGYQDPRLVKAEQANQELKYQLKKTESRLEEVLTILLSQEKELLKLREKEPEAATENRSKVSQLSEHPVEILHSVQPTNPQELTDEYRARGLHNEPHTFALYRAIGNDLYPRHKKGQSRENLRFILENEPDFANCEKIFVVNRIVDKAEEQAIIDLLKQSSYNYLHVPFIEEEYKRIGFDTDCLPEPGYLASKDYENLVPEQQSRVLLATYRLKNNYVTNNNGARNTALRDGKKRAKWVLPWDGNCFITGPAWDLIYNTINEFPYLKYFVVPMARVTDNNQLLTNHFYPNLVEEPQLIFRKDSAEEFNENFCYGTKPKVELFWRLGIPGKWDNWTIAPWELKKSTLSKEAGQFGVAGWVARLFSGNSAIEQDSLESFRERGRVRLKSIHAILSHCDKLVSELKPETLLIYNNQGLEQESDHYQTSKEPLLKELGNRLIKDADEALTLGPYTVTDKTTLPPSGCANDYWHISPYYWPNPDTPDGLPYIYRDGERAPGTRMYEPDSDQYDRTRLQCLFDDSIILALAWKFSGQQKYALHGARLLEHFFINPATKMNPHLKFAQVRPGHHDNQGAASGIIEMKDLYYYLDAVRLLMVSGALTDQSIQQFKAWLEEYLHWLLDSPQGQAERLSDNNHGTYYDLQVASIAGILGKQDLLNETLVRAQSRIATQFNPDGSQPGELKRTITQHYCCFNLQGWANLTELASRCHLDLWAYQAPNKAGLKQGFKWFLSHMGKKWPYPQIDQFDQDRFLPLYFAAHKQVELPVDFKIPAQKYAVKPRYHPHDGIRPYWNLGLGKI